jgi:hypothetical protein
MSELTQKRVNAARAIGMIADLVQMGLFPLFFEGALSPANAVLDVIVGIALWRLVGWSWAFLPTFAAELIPAVDLFPSWTAAVLFATRKGAAEAVIPSQANGDVATAGVPIIDVEAREVRLGEGDGRPRE